MIRHALALAMSGTAGYLAWDLLGAVLAVLTWPALVMAWQRVAPGFARAWDPAEPSLPSTYADIEDIIDALDDLARERGWDFPKHLAIAQLACEHRTTTFDELERCYDRGLRPAPCIAGTEDPQGQAHTGAR